MQLRTETMEADMDEKITLLLNMGFSDINEIRQALCASRNDVSEAVSYLTHERVLPASALTPPSVEVLDGLGLGTDVTDGRAISSGALVPFGPSLPMHGVEVPGTSMEGAGGEREEEGFPASQLYELESRVFTNQWSIPYKREEALGQCLLAAIRMVKLDTFESEDLWRRFVEQCLPEAFRKLLTSIAVRNWRPDVQEGVFQMSQLLVELVADLLKHNACHYAHPVMAQVLTLVFDPENEWHQKNRCKEADYQQWKEVFGEGRLYAQSPEGKDPVGWLVDLVNSFGDMGGFVLVAESFESSTPPSLGAMASLLLPLGSCASVLNPAVVAPILKPCCKIARDTLDVLTEKQLRVEPLRAISDLLVALTSLSIAFWSDQVQYLADLRLALILRMLKTPSFNVRMHALKEISRLIEETESPTPKKTAVDPSQVLVWMTYNQILSVALEGNMDHPQYSERIRGLVEFLGPRLSSTELSRIWALQDGQDTLLVDNVHVILVAAAPKLPPQELEHLFGLVEQRWQSGNEPVRERLLVFLGRIGREGSRLLLSSNRAATRVLELLWEMAHGPELLNPSLMCRAMEEHLSTLMECGNKEQMCRLYVGKCVDDIHTGTNVFPSLCHLNNVVRSLAHGSGVHKPDKSVMYDLTHKCELMKLVTSSLGRCHQKSVQTAMKNEQPLGPHTSLESGNTHGHVMAAHLDFIQFLLKDADMYLMWNHCEELWDTLIANQHACEADREACFRWLAQCLPDLQPETQQQLFREKLLGLDPATLSVQGFHCFRSFFECVNTIDGRFRRISQHITVERQETIGLEMVWSLLLESPSEIIAQQAVELLMNQALRNMNIRSHNKIIAQHQRFIGECDRRLKTSLSQVTDTALTSAMSSATRTLTALAVVKAASLPSPTRTSCFQHVNRLLLLARHYVAASEESFLGVRTLPPHGITFRGRPVRLHLLLDPPGTELQMDCHGTELVRSVKQRIVAQTGLNLENLQFYWYIGGGVGAGGGPGRGEQIIEALQDGRMMNQLWDQEEVGWVIRTGPTVTASGVRVQEVEENWDEESTTVSGGSQSGHQEQEKLLPGVIMATTSNIFDLLFHLASLEDERVTASVHHLLHLLPTDPSIMEAIDLVLFPPSPSSAPSTPSSSPQKGRSPAKPNLKPPPAPPPPDPDALKKLLDASNEGMSAFRVLYNLEVLSSKLLPMEERSSEDNRRCWKAFLESGGLQVLLSLLGGEALPLEGSVHLRQHCCLISLQLLKQMLVGGDTSQPPVTAEILEKEEQTGRIVLCLIRVAWAAAAGHLQLASVSTPSRDSPLLSMASVRQNSTGSSASSGSESEASFLHGGVCAQQKFLSNDDSLIARLALKLLGTWLQTSPELIASFFSFPSIRDFLVDTVLGSPCAKVRETASQMLQELSKISLNSSAKFRGHEVPPRFFLLQMLLKAPVPLWVTSPTVRGTTQRLIGQCEQYFVLLARLLEGLSEEQQQQGHVELARLLDDEQSWLGNYTPGPGGGEHLLRGHLLLLRSLFSCQGSGKCSLGPPLISSLLSSFLFPASQIGVILPPEAPVTLPKCDSSLTRSAAYDLLVELARECPKNAKNLCSQLVVMHHQHSPELAREFEFEPQLESRASCGYVGLKNAGATCYMNSILQHLFMVPGIKEAILAVPEDNVDEGSLFFQMQMIMGTFMESRLQYYVPDQFWQSLRLKGRPVNVREQQDAFEFFTHLVDEVDEYLAKLGCSKVFQPRFQGIFLDQKICRDCPHRYTHEEAFLALNLTVKSHVLEDSLAQFVKEELLEGDNAYFCEKCGCKRAAIKHLSLKSLPPTLVIQLKRFHYDWEAGRSLKFDDYFQFPWELDLGHYTVDGTGCIYELVGVVVHSGQASAGHYYSFIKERRNETQYLANKGKWFKFNDTTVEECPMDEGMLEAECFGGTYRAKVTPSGAGCSLPEERQRYWNAYMLLYERCEIVHTPKRVTAGRSKSFRNSGSTSSRPPGRRGDSLSQLSALLCQGERQGLFSEPLPSRVGKAVQEANLRFLRGRDVFCPEYCCFVKELCRTCVHGEENECLRGQGDEAQGMSVITHATRLGAHFLLNTYCHTKLCNTHELRDWLQVMKTAVTTNRVACGWLLAYLAGEEGQHHLRPFLLECPLQEVRMHFAVLLENVLQAFFDHGGPPTDVNLDLLMDSLLHLLESDVPDSWRTAGQFFSLLLTYAQMGLPQRNHLLQKGAFRRLLIFLLGPRALDASNPAAPRMWTSLQLREFADVHRIMAVLVLSCDLSSLQTCNQEGLPPRQPFTCCPQEHGMLLSLPSDVEAAIDGNSLAPLFIAEMVRCCRELGSAVAVVTDMLVQASFCSQRFSSLLLTQCLLQYASVPSNELRNLSHLLLEFLVSTDPLQEWRLQAALEGCTPDECLGFTKHVDGLLALLRAHQSSDSRRSYQCLKLLVALAGRSPVAKDLLLRGHARWQWAVSWLQQRMAAHSPWSSNESTPTATQHASSSSAIGSTAIGTDMGSNEEGGVGRAFQRTTSAQVTLEEAAALLTESQTTAMDVDIEDAEGELEEIGSS